MGINPIPVELPKLPYGAMVGLLGAEAAAAFDDLTLSGRDRLLTEQGPDDWPNQFRTARFYPAVEYIQANRARSLAVQQVSALFEKVDIIVASSGGAQLLATNLTGHPALIVPNGLRGDDAPKPPKTDDGDNDNIGGPGTPVSITFLAGLYDDAKSLPSHMLTNWPLASTSCTQSSIESTRNERQNRANQSLTRFALFAFRFHDARSM